MNHYKIVHHLYTKANKLYGNGNKPKATAIIRHIAEKYPIESNLWYGSRFIQEAKQRCYHDLKSQDWSQLYLDSEFVVYSNYTPYEIYSHDKIKPGPLSTYKALTCLNAHLKRISK